MRASKRSPPLANQAVFFRLRHRTGANVPTYANKTPDTSALTKKFMGSPKANAAKLMPKMHPSAIFVPWIAADFILDFLSHAHAAATAPTAALHAAAATKLALHTKVPAAPTTAPTATACSLAFWQAAFTASAAFLAASRLCSAIVRSASAFFTASYKELQPSIWARFETPSLHSE